MPAVTTTFTNYNAKNISSSSGSPTTVYTTAAGNSATITGLSVSNTSGLSITASVMLSRGGITVYVVKDATVPAGGSLTVAGWDQKIVLNGNGPDLIQAYCSAANSADVILSCLECTGNAITAGAIPLNPPAGYPTVLAANEVFKFTIESGTLPFIPDVSSHAWTPPGGSRGTSGLSLVAGGPFGTGQYFYNASAGNSAGIATLATTTYASYHNSVIAAANWAFEAHVRVDVQGAYNSSTTANLYESGVCSVQINQQSGSASLYKLSIGLASSTTANSGSGGSINMPTFTAGVWNHLVVSRTYISPTNSNYYVHVNGVLQGSVNLTFSYELYSASAYGTYIGTVAFGAPNYSLDNVRLVLGNPFNLLSNGFATPTSAFTA